MTNSRSKPLDPQNTPRYKGVSELPLVTVAKIGYELLLGASTEAKIALLQEIIDSDFGGNAAAFSRHKGINRGLVSKALNKGYIAPALARVMGWPITAPVPVCFDCGEAHVVGYCTKLHGEPQRPKPPTKRKRHQIRLAASLTKERRDALRELAAEEGKTWTEYCELLADVYIEYKKDCIFKE